MRHWNSIVLVWLTAGSLLLGEVVPVSARVPLSLTQAAEHSAPQTPVGSAALDSADGQDHHPVVVPERAALPLLFTGTKRDNPTTGRPDAAGGAVVWIGSDTVRCGAGPCSVSSLLQRSLVSSPPSVHLRI